MSWVYPHRLEVIPLKIKRTTAIYKLKNIDLSAKKFLIFIWKEYKQYKKIVN